MAVRIGSWSFLAPKPSSKPLCHSAIYNQPSGKPSLASSIFSTPRLSNILRNSIPLFNAPYSQGQTWTPPSPAFHILFCTYRKTSIHTSTKSEFLLKQRTHVRGNYSISQVASFFLNGDDQSFLLRSSPPTAVPALLE